MAYPQTKVTMKTVIEKSAAQAPALKTATAKAPDIASASVPDTLATLNVIVSQIVLDALHGLKMDYPKTTPKRRRELKSIRQRL
jgi:hypothetical protein